MSATETETPIVQYLEAQVAEETAQAWMDYRALLARASEPKPGDAAKLRELLPMIGKTPADVERDAAVFDEIARLESNIAGVDVNALAERAEKLAADARALDEERQRFLDEQRRKRNAIVGELGSINRARRRRGDNERKLGELRAANWQLLGLPEPEAEPAEKTNAWDAVEFPLSDRDPEQERKNAVPQYGKPMGWPD